MNKFKEYAGVFLFWALAVVVAVAILAFFPLVTIWALNTLFFAGTIPYTFTTWLAIMVLNITVLGNLSKASMVKRLKSLDRKIKG